MGHLEVREEAGRSHSGPSVERSPAAWVRTEELEIELWNAIAEDFSQTLESVSEYDCDDEPSSLEDEFSDEHELRGIVFRQLADLRPELGDRFSRPFRSA